MALSPVGTQADLDVVTALYQEDWWLQCLAARNASCIWQKQWFPHNYQLTAVEAYADAYILTGDPTYLAAVMGAWECESSSWDCSTCHRTVRRLAPRPRVARSASRQLAARGWVGGHQ